MVGGLSRRRVEAIENEVGGRQVRVADAERDELFALLDLLLLDLVDLGEDVRREFFEAVRLVERVGHFLISSK